MADEILILENAVKHFPIRGGLFKRSTKMVRAVDGVNLSILPGQTFGLVGESGCGKTTVAKLILLLEQLTSGRILFKGKSIQEFSKDELREYRRAIQVVFQDPYSSLNPRTNVGHIVGEPLEVSGTMTDREIKRRVADVLGRVGLPPEATKLFPHEFSGGQRQRIAIARAFASSPELVILDEPASALDVSIRAQILNLFLDLQRDTGISYLFISHDLAAVEYLSQEIGVMYLGKLVETGPAGSVCADPLHPYSRMLLAAALPAYPGMRRKEEIVGDVPSPIDLPPGCRFYGRCAYAKNECQEHDPGLERVDGSDRWVACPYVPARLNVPRAGDN